MNDTAEANTIHQTIGAVPMNITGQRARQPGLGVPMIRFRQIDNGIRSFAAFTGGFCDD
jgi:hypothetical protein